MKNNHANFQGISLKVKIDPARTVPVFGIEIATKHEREGALYRHVCVFGDVWSFVVIPVRASV